MGRNGSLWARIRIASTTRIFDRTENQWRDGDTVFIDVMCWRRLAENVVATLQRGDRVLVAGRLRQRDYEDAQGVRHTNIDIDAEAVGPDLGRCSARLIRPTNPQPAVPADDSTPDDAAPGALSTVDIAPEELIDAAGLAA